MFCFIHVDNRIRVQLYFLCHITVHFYASNGLRYKIFLRAVFCQRERGFLGFFLALMKTSMKNIGIILVKQVFVNKVTKGVA